MALILFSNIVYILDNYTVSWFQLLSTEVTLVRGIVQVLVFGFVILLKNRRQSQNNTEVLSAIIFLHLIGVFSATLWILGLFLAQS